MGQNLLRVCINRETDNFENDEFPIYLTTALLKDVPPTTVLHTPMMVSQQLESSELEHQPSRQTQNDVSNMEVESCEGSNVPWQQKEAAPSERSLSELLPITPNQQRRHNTEEQTSGAHDARYLDPHLQSSADALEKSGC